MIITISGLAGTGKTTLGKLLARELGYRFIGSTLREVAKKKGMDLLELQRLAEKDESIDRELDEYLKEESKKGNCVVATWLAPWIVGGDLKIWLFAPFEIRAKRIAERDGISVEEAKRRIREREKSNEERYKKLYGINIKDYTIFDLCFNTATFKPEDMVKIIKEVLKWRQ